MTPLLDDVLALLLLFVCVVAIGLGLHVFMPMWAIAA